LRKCVGFNLFQLFDSFSVSVCNIHYRTSERIVRRNNRGCWLDVCLCWSNSHNVDRLNTIDHLRCLQLRQRNDLLLELIVSLLTRSRVLMLGLLTITEVVPVLKVWRGVSEVIFHQFKLSFISYCGEAIV